MNCLLRHLQPHLSSSLVTAEEEGVDLVANMRLVRVKCNLIVGTSSSRQASLTLASSRPRDLPILAIQGSNRATSSIILAWPPTTPSTTIPLARLVTHQTTIQGMSKATLLLLLLPMLSLDLVTTRTCTLQVTKSKYNFC